MSGGADEQNRGDSATSLEKYLMMNEQEKDAEIVKAVARLQKRIQQILYVLETEQRNFPRSNQNNEKK